jgi:hypothetical protein
MAHPYTYIQKKVEGFRLTDIPSEEACIVSARFKASELVLNSNKPEYLIFKPKKRKNCERYAYFTIKPGYPSA